MALQCNLELPSGISLTNAYLKVYSLTGNKDLIISNVQIYVSKEKSDSQGVPVAGTSFSFRPDVSAQAENFLKQAYDHIKSLPDYADAVDC